MIGIVFRYGTHRYRIRMMVCGVYGNAVPLFNSKKNCRLFSKNNAFLRQRQLLVSFPGSKRYKRIQSIRLLRYKKIDIIAFPAWSLYLHRFLLNIHGLTHFFIFKQTRLYLRFLLGRKFLLQNSRQIIMIQFSELNAYNIPDRIVHTKSGEHQSAASSNPHHSHQHSFFIAKQVAECHFITKGKPVPKKSDPFQQYPFPCLWRFRTHQRSRLFRHFFPAGKQNCYQHCNSGRQRRSNGNPHSKRGTGGNHRIKDTIGVINNRREQIHTDSQSCQTACYSRHQRVNQKLRYNCARTISQCFQSSNLCTLFLYHAGHSRQADQRRHKQKEHRKHTGNRSDSI